MLYLLGKIGLVSPFHDIARTGQAASNNGLFPTVPGYDLATGLGSPKMAALITGTF